MSKMRSPNNKSKPVEQPREVRFLRTRRILLRMLQRVGQGELLRQREVPRELCFELPLKRKFTLTDLSGKIKKEYYAPEARACPACKAVLMNVEKCKHTDCPTCGKSFCWLCLSIKDQSGVWPCGSFNLYCGLASNQRIHS